MHTVRSDHGDGRESKSFEEIGSSAFQTLAQIAVRLRNPFDPPGKRPQPWLQPIPDIGLLIRRIVGDGDDIRLRRPAFLKNPADELPIGKSCRFFTEVGGEAGLDPSRRGMLQEYENGPLHSPCSKGRE